MSNSRIARTVSGMEGMWKLCRSRMREGRGPPRRGARHMAAAALAEAKHAAAAAYSVTRQGGMGQTPRNCTMFGCRRVASRPASCGQRHTRSVGWGPDAPGRHAGKRLSGGRDDSMRAQAPPLAAPARVRSLASSRPHLLQLLRHRLAHSQHRLVCAGAGAHARRQQHLHRHRDRAPLAQVHLCTQGGGHTEA